MSRVWRRTGEKFRDIVKERTNDECGMRRVGGREEKVVNGGVKKLVCVTVVGKRRAVDEWLQRRYRDTYI